MKVRARGRIDAVRVLARIDKVLGHEAAAKMELEISNLPALEIEIHTPDPDGTLSEVDRCREAAAP